MGGFAAIMGFHTVCYAGHTGHKSNGFFLLGGSSFDWLNTSQGPAHCVADLNYWSYQGGTEVQLARVN